MKLLRLVSLLGLASVVLGACERGAHEKKPSAVPVKVQTLADTKIPDFTDYVSTLRSRHAVSVQPQVDGQILKILVKSGDVVEAGTTLMQIDPARQAASVSSAQANQISNQANLQYAKQAYDRAARLHEGGVVSAQELDEATARWNSAKAQDDALGAQVRQNRVQLEYYRIVAPVHGTVGDVPVRVGDHVTPATHLTTLDENNLLEAYISLPIERAPELRPDLDVQLFSSGGEELFKGKVSFLSPQVNEDTQTILAKVLVENQDGHLRASQFVRARITWNVHEGVTVPALSVTRVNGQPFVYVAVGEAGKLVAAQRPIAVGELLGSNYVVRSGVSAHEKLIVSGVQHLSDGDAVVELPAPTASARN